MDRRDAVLAPLVLGAGGLLTTVSGQMRVDGKPSVDAGIETLGAAAIDAMVLPVGRAAMLRYRKLMDFMVHKRLPALTDHRWHWADPLPLLSFGAHFPTVLQQAAGHVDRILWGESKPGALPMQQPTKFEWVINLKTAKLLGSTIPQSLLLRADEVIQ